MSEIVSFDQILFTVFNYLLLTFALILILHYYAKRKLKGKVAPMNVLRVMRQTAFIICLAATLIIFASIKIFHIEYTQKMLSFLGIPYFIAATFYAVNVFRRIKAERMRRL